LDMLKAIGKSAVAAGTAKLETLLPSFTDSNLIPVIFFSQTCADNVQHIFDLQTPNGRKMLQLQAFTTNHKAFLRWEDQWIECDDQIVISCPLLSIEKKKNSAEILIYKQVDASQVKECVYTKTTITGSSTSKTEPPLLLAQLTGKQSPSPRPPKPPRPSRILPPSQQIERPQSPIGQRCGVIDCKCKDFTEHTFIKGTCRVCSHLSEEHKKLESPTNLLCISAVNNLVITTNSQVKQKFVEKEPRNTELQALCSSLDGNKIDALIKFVGAAQQNEQLWSILSKWSESSWNSPPIPSKPKPLLLPRPGRNN